MEPPSQKKGRGLQTSCKDNDIREPKLKDEKEERGLENWGGTVLSGI